MARRARGEQEAALRLQTRAHYFVRVCGHRCGHLCHRGAKQNRMRRYWPIVAMPFCTVILVRKRKKKIGERGGGVRTRDYLELLVERELDCDVGDA